VEAAEVEQVDLPEAPEESPAESPSEGLEEVQTAAAQRARDEAGRFAKAQAAAKQAAGEQQTGAPKPSAGSTTEVKPPASWKPAVREHWGKLPPEVRQEVARREAEVSKLLQQAAEHRRVADTFTKALEPYRAFIAGDPAEEVKGLLQTAVNLRTGSPAQKAAIAAQIISGFGIDPAHVAEVLERGAPSQATQQTAQQQFRDPRFDVLMGHLQQTAAQRAQSAKADAARQLEEFAASHEFVNDVGPLMSNLMKAARETGQPITLDDAYEQACMLHKDVRPLYQQRKAAHDAANARASTQRARAASSSIRHEPTAPASGAQSNSLRDTIMASMGALGRR
jgi:hypothetical protein